jgi:hypothetical protein
MRFIKWLGVVVPAETEAAILGAERPAEASIGILTQVLKEILAGAAGCGVPLGINVESVSIFREEIDAAHNLFRGLQGTLLDALGTPWTVRWLPIGKQSMVSSGSSENLARLAEALDETKPKPAAAPAPAPPAVAPVSPRDLALGAGLVALGVLIGRAFRRA